ncbi:MAG: Hpt domain-containing protein [Planctomycetota bacterium]
MTPHPEPFKLESALPLDDPDLRSIVERWVDSLTQKTQEMRSAADASDLETLASLAHWLKGSGGTAGYDDFTDPARRLEKAARAGQLGDVEASLSEIERLGAGVRAGLAEG